jgi:predicted nucleotidyltransferase
MTDFERVFEVLGEHQIRFVVVGGVAVVMQGHPRMTADLDLFVSFDPVNAREAIKALGTLGYRPRPPVDAMGFADAAIRRQWADEKGMVVLSLWSDSLPATEIDLFIREPLPFEDLWRRASRVPVGEVEVAVASIEDLIALKEKVARPRDLQDIAELRKLLDERGPD